MKEKYNELVATVKNYAHFPFVLDEQGFHAMAGKYHIWMFVDDNGDFNVTVDGFGEKHFDQNIEWIGFDTPEDALRMFFTFYRNYLNACFK